MKISSNDNIETKIEYLKTRTDLNVARYAEEIIKSIAIVDYNGNHNQLIELMQMKSKDPRDITPLTMWCCDVAILLGFVFADNDYIERGYIKLSNTSYNSSRYFHCWFCFNYKDNWYVFDPCNNILATKEDYYYLFEPDVKGRVISSKVKESIAQELDNKIYFYEENSFQIIREESGLSSPLYACWSIMKLENGSVEVKFVNYNNQQNQYKYEEAIKKIENRGASIRK